MGGEKKKSEKARYVYLYLFTSLCIFTLFASIVKIIFSIVIKIQHIAELDDWTVSKFFTTNAF